MARPEEIDVVKLTAPAGGWPAGTIGTVISTSHGELALLEITTGGSPPAMVAAPYRDLDLVWSAPRAP